MVAAFCNEWIKAENLHVQLVQVHYPVEAIQNVPFADSKMQLLEAQVSIS